MRVCVFGRGCHADLTIVLLLLICCVPQMGVDLSHKLSLCSKEKKKKKESITLAKESQSAEVVAVVFLLQRHAAFLYVCA